MYTMGYDITVGSYRVGMLDRVEIHRSTELLADTASIVLPGAEYNRALEVEGKLKRGDRVSISIGYRETGLREEFSGWLQRVATDGGSITLECEDDLFLFRRPLPDETLADVTLSDLLRKVVEGVGGGFSVDCDYTWTYGKFVISTATGYDVLKKVQEECGADIYIKDSTLHIHPPGAQTGEELLYDFALNVEDCDLTYRKAEERKVQVVVKALMPDGSVKEIEVGATGGDRVEVRSAAADDGSMKQRGEAELKRLSFDGYDGSVTTWLVPYCEPGCSAELHDADYEYKNGKYYVRAVTTEFSRDGGRRTLELGFRLS